MKSLPPRARDMADDRKGDDVSGTVKLISADGHEFVIDRKAAMVSGTIRSMLSGPGKALHYHG